MLRKCAENVIRTIEILESLGFYVKIEKSEIIPKQQITFLGFITTNSFHMAIILTTEKTQKKFNLCTATKLAHTLTSKKLVKLIGNLVASMEAVSYGRLFYKQLGLPQKQLIWWENSIMTATKSLKKLPIDTTIYTDASFDGWEAVCEKSETGSMCTKQEQALHINTIELLRDKLGLLSFFKDNKDIKHIRIIMDNNTAVAYTNNMGN